MTLEQFANQNWKDCIKTISELSMDTRGRKSLIDSNHLGYSFDDICSLIYTSGDKPFSVDALFLEGDTVLFVEYKSGVKQRITKDNFNWGLVPSGLSDSEKTDYRRLLIENSQRAKEIIIDSFKLKAVESYILFEKKILANPKISINRDKIKVKLLFVVDVAGDEISVDILKDVSKKYSSNEDCSSIRDSLKRFGVKEDENGKKYYYDSVDVVSSILYQKRLTI